MGLTFPAADAFISVLQYLGPLDSDITGALNVDLCPLQGNVTVFFQRDRGLAHFDGELVRDFDDTIFLAGNTEIIACTARRIGTRKK